MTASDFKNVPSELIKDLTNFADRHTLSLREVAQYGNMIATRDEILRQHKIPITQIKTSKRWHTRLPNGKQIAKTKLEDLEYELILYYLSESVTQQQSTQPSLPITQKPDRASEPPKPVDNNCTLKSIYPEWLALRKHEVSKNTLAHDLNYWNDYIKNHDIANIPLSQLKRSTLKRWACEMIKKHDMKKQYFSNVKGTLCSLLDFAVDEELLDVNHMRSIKLNSHLFKPATFKEKNEEVFTEEEQKLVMLEAEADSKQHDDAIPLDICLLFLTGMRVGELYALRNCDIKGNYLEVCRMVVASQTETSDGGLVQNGYTIVEHAKTSAGMRQIYLTDKAREYLAQIQKLNRMNKYRCGDNDSLFQRKEGMCNQRVFDSRLKKYCNPHHLNLPFAKSCHDIRRTYISRLLGAGKNPDTVRRIAGHENIEMTMKYCRSYESQEELEKDLEEILG